MRDACEMTDDSRKRPRVEQGDSSVLAMCQSLSYSRYYGAAALFFLILRGEMPDLRRLLLKVQF
jgi:hypothetical protein